jgi:hypothetical protein
MPLTIEQIRHLNARLLVDEAGSQSKFAERMEQSRQQVSHYASRTPIKNIGSALARRIEVTFQRPIGWMDRPNGPPLYRPVPQAPQPRTKIPAALAKQIERLVEDFLVAAPVERAAIVARAARAARRAEAPCWRRPKTEPLLRVVPTQN